MKKLRPIRIAVSTAFILMFLWAFLGPARPNEYFNHTITALQFIPSMLEFSASFLAGGGAGFILIAALTFFYGRVYCSSLCPLGTMQDCFIAAGSKISRPKFRYRKSTDWLIYTVTGVSLVLLAFGIPSLLNLLEPYSNFGRIAVDLIKPALVYTNNAAEYVLTTFDAAILKPSSLQYISPGVFGFVSGFFLLILGSSVYGGRVYCNTVCPVGGILGLISRFSVNRLAISQEKCTSCGLCEKSCKAGCVDYKNRRIDFARCVSCYNCVDACKFGAISYVRGRGAGGNTGYSGGRRKTIVAIWTAAAGLGLAFSGAGKLMAQINTKLVPVKRDNNIIPPGGISLKHFSQRCTGCNMCVSSCPTRVIAPSFAETGVKSLTQVRMDYDTAYCDYGCNRCSHVCPTGALMPLTPEKKKITQLGVAKFLNYECVVVKHGTVCAACNEHCPTKAVKMAPYKGDLNIPQVDEKICIGCGACEHVCPARPKAIYVQPNDVQRLAEKPSAVKQKVRELKEFPF